MNTCRRGCRRLAQRRGRGASMSPRSARHSEATCGVGPRGQPVGDGLEASRVSDREAGLDHVHAQPLELAGDLELLARAQADARRLLAVP